MFHFDSTGQILVPFWFQQPGRAAAGRAAGTKMEPKFGQWNQNGTEMEHTYGSVPLNTCGDLLLLPGGNKSRFRSTMNCNQQPAGSPFDRCRIFRCLDQRHWVSSSITANNTWAAKVPNCPNRNAKSMILGNLCPFRKPGDSSNIQACSKMISNDVQMCKNDQKVSGTWPHL